MWRQSPAYKPKNLNCKENYSINYVNRGKEMYLFQKDSVCAELRILPVNFPLNLAEQEWLIYPLIPVVIYQLCISAAEDGDAHLTGATEIEGRWDSLAGTDLARLAWIYSFVI